MKYLYILILLLITTPCESTQIEDIASVIAAEACSEGEIGQIAVANTILNRSKSRRISPLSVVKQRNQYYGWTNKNRLKIYAQCKKTADKIAIQVINSTLEDITNGAEYFLLPTERLRVWHGKKTVTIGKHTFYQEAK